MVGLDLIRFSRKAQIALMWKEEPEAALYSFCTQSNFPIKFLFFNNLRLSGVVLNMSIQSEYLNCVQSMLLYLKSARGDDLMKSLTICEITVGESFEGALDNLCRASCLRLL